MIRKWKGGERVDGDNVLERWICHSFSGNSKPSFAIDEMDLFAEELLESLSVISYRSAETSDIVEVRSSFDIIKKYRKEESVFSVVDDVFEKGGLEFDSPYGPDKAVCVGSCFLNKQFNLLVFRGPEKGFFVVFQRVGFCEAIWLIEENLFVTLKSSNLYLSALRSYVSWWANSLISEAQHGQPFLRYPVRFGGIIASFHRPFHYFYQLLSGVDSWFQRVGKFSKIPASYSVASGNFSSISRLYDLGVKKDLVFDSESELNDFLIGERRFLLNPATSNEKPRLDAVTQVVVEDSLRFAELRSSVVAARDAVTKSDVSVLVSLMLENRVWKNQKDFICELAYMLSADFRKPIIVLDGLTSTESYMPLGSIARKYEEEISEVHDLVRHLCEVTSVHAMTSREKLLIGRHLDLCVCDKATSSMFYSRFLDRKVIMHGNISMDYSAHQYGTNSIDLAESLKVVEDESKNPLKADYRLDTSVLVKTVSDCLKSRRVSGD